MGIIEQLEADRAERERRQLERKRGVHGRKDWISNLHQTYANLETLAFVDDRSRDDLIALVDHAIAGAEAMRKEDDAAELEDRKVEADAEAEYYLRPNPTEAL